VNPADYLPITRCTGPDDGPTRRGERRDDLYGAGLRVSLGGLPRPPM